VLVSEVYEYDGTVGVPPFALKPAPAVEVFVALTVVHVSAAKSPVTVPVTAFAVIVVALIVPVLVMLFTPIANVVASVTAVVLTINLLVPNVVKAKLLLPT
jgi:hypothetical protein